MYYTSALKEFTFAEFVEREIDELENYPVSFSEEIKKKYSLSDTDKVIWVSPNPSIAWHYLLGASARWDTPASEIDFNRIQAFSNEDGFIIPETDDGDGGFLFVLIKVSQ